MTKQKPFLDLYSKYVDSCFAKHEDPLTFRRWLGEVYKPPSGCKKCKQAQNTLLSKGVKLKDGKD